MKTITNQEVIDKAEMMLMGLQLINDYAEDVINSKLVSNTTKYKLQNLLRESRYFTELFWKNMDTAAELEFNQKVRIIEETIENLNRK